MTATQQATITLLGNLEQLQDLLDEEGFTIASTQLSGVLDDYYADIEEIANANLSPHGRRHGANQGRAMGQESGCRCSRGRGQAEDNQDQATQEADNRLAQPAGGVLP